MRRGFTFIEILVVITIIGVLMMIGAANFSVANKKARDGRRQGDLEQIRSALELYRTEEGTYPANLNLLVPDYIGAVPDDPLAARAYGYSGGGQTYGLCAALELGSGSVGGCGGGCGSTCNYKVTNPL